MFLIPVNNLKNSSKETGNDICKNWKQKLDKVCNSRFDSRKHSILVEESIKNVEQNFKADEKGKPLKGSSEVYLLVLAKSIFAVIKNKVTIAKSKL